LRRLSSPKKLRLLIGRLSKPVDRKAMRHLN
jgi:hypothetical protein